MAIKEWCCFLEGTRFTLETDHHPLIFLQTQATLSQKQARWLEFLQQFEFEVKHISGKENRVADALSRMQGNAVTQVGEQQSWVAALKNLVGSWIQEAQQSMDTEGEHSPWKVKDGLYFYKDRLFVASEEVRTASLWEAHNGVAAGHTGVHRTFQLLNRQYYWPEMRR